ncbi:hypothetical protein DAPPUDRAFT_246512 [Daphnia pulex]|uniref:Peptidase C1A papain C-terminal domain-containing protein n=1 Tax=Daphnia pulex TaxID=6669 RepID=E9GQQ1_DAPPU|nr:hypothetical protein DAPPUDRAFT_246512 [Daphnia pulex]|eukprot:EFX78290.1 hypothetical protein DAPPUDRAFT_246512 [Daphnia pulex]
MKLLFAFAIIVIGLAVVFGTPDAWNEYKNKHGKKFNATDDAQRKKNFLATDAIITKHNSQKNGTYKLEHNQFSDMVDYRTHACLSPVRDQKQCGSCWAFSAITPLEFARCKKNGTLLALSEQHLVDCEPYDYGCNGGWYTNAWYYIKNGALGSAKQSLYPYTATNTTCKFTSSMVGAKISTYGNLQPLNATNMQLAVQSNGSISVAITVTNSFFYYSGGTYNDVACDNKTIPINHAVVIVGYGAANATNYWIVRNSWGTGWGQAGYVFIQRGVNKCKIEQYPAVILSVV